MEADTASVSGFRLDKYLVTVGRFRKFVSAWNGGTGWLPAPESGKHTYLNGGAGLVNVGSSGGSEPGWVMSDDSDIAPTDTNLACNANYVTWTPSAGNNEILPINCVNWWEAYAFCIWDGGFLPSEAEWEYAAAGGSDQLEYPWGTAAPGASNDYAIYGCNYPPMDSGSTCNVAPVGTATQGGGRWGQLDLSGDVWEWNLDSYATYANPCMDCANLTPGAAQARVLRGGVFFNAGTSDLLPPNRNYDPPTSRNVYFGFRCARSP
jgi:formylglycine-generating enzyme required for sulfatase activity